MNKKITLATIAGISLLMGYATPAQAGYSTVGSCVNPQATLEQTNEGVHGVFNINAFAGTDLIYKKGNDVLQCLCTVDGKGYETVWIDSTDKNEAALASEGFMHVPFPKEWGLKEDRRYMAKNVEYVCKVPAATAKPTPTITTTPAPTSAAATPTPTNAPAATATSTAAPAQAAVNKVAGAIASTGNAFVIYASILAGAASLIVGMVLKRFSK